MFVHDTPQICIISCTLAPRRACKQRDAEVSERLMVAADLAVGHPERAAVLRAEADAITAMMGDV